MLRARFIPAAATAVLWWVTGSAAQTAAPAVAGDGLIVRVQSADLVFIDKGQSDGIRQGDVFDIVSSEVLVHPLSDSILAVTPKSVGALQVVQVFDRTSLARVVQLDPGEDPMLKPISRVRDPQRLEEIERRMKRGERAAAGVAVPRRVAVIPGLYQVRIGEQRKGWVLMAAEAASLVGALIQRDNSNTWLDSYDNLTARQPPSEFDRRFKKAQDFRDSSNRLFWLAGALYVYNWVDVLWLGGGGMAYAPRTEAAGIHVGAGLSAAGQPLLRLSCRF